MHRSPVSIWFRLAGLAAALFCVTASAWAAAGMGDQNHPLKRWLGRYGLILIAIEAAVVVVAAVLGMLIPESSSGGFSADEAGSSDSESRDRINH